MARAVDDPRYPHEAGACPLSRWSGRSDRCRWCDEPAAAGFAWCSNPCEDGYRRNHWWDVARHAALARDDRRCVRCRLGPDTLLEARWLLRALVPMGPVAAAHLWQSAEWAALGQACAVEVHHRVPLLGAGYGAGCHHHLDGLETLCHRHHVAVTLLQARQPRSA